MNSRLVILNTALSLLFGLLSHMPPAIASAPAAPMPKSSADSTQHDASFSVHAIDVFGTTQISTEQVLQAWGDTITKFAEAVYSNHPNPEVDVGSLYQEIITGIQVMGDFAYVDVSPILYFEEGNPIFVTIDIVDAVDASVRMPFRAAPTGRFDDPEGLFQQWAEYEETGIALSRAGELSDGYDQCPALSCTFGFEHPDLQKFLPIFEAAIPPNREQLTQILQGDRDAAHRGYAVFLLAFTDDPTSYVQAITPAIKDSSSLVRNNALRVLIHIAQDYPEVPIPIAQVVEALGYPNTTDRNKAAYILVELAKRAEHRETLIEQAVPILLEMLKLQQPNNHDPAYRILTQLSGQQYGARDYAAWEQWAEQAR